MKKKPVIYCGVTDQDGNYVKMSKKERETFTKMCSNGGKYRAIFCEYSKEIILHL